MKDQKRLKGKRKGHLEAVRSIVGMNNYDKQREKVFMMAKKIFVILSTSLERLTKNQENESEMKKIQYSKEILHGNLSIRLISFS